MTHPVITAWIGAAIVIAAAVTILGLLYFLYAHPDRSERLGTRYRSYLFAGAGCLWSVLAIFDASRREWSEVVLHAVVASIWFSGWCLTRRATPTGTR